MSFYTYILFSESKDRYYIGSCSDINQRLKRHNEGATPSTKSGRPWKVVWFNLHLEKSGALKQENYIKRMKSRNYIEKLIHEKIYGGSAG